MNIDERNVLIELLKAKPEKVGEKWYLLSTAWFTVWCDYISVKLNPENAIGLDLVEDKSNRGSIVERPGPIDNSILSDFDKTNDMDLEIEETKYPIKKGLMERKDFVLISEDAWRKYAEIYAGGPSIARYSIQVSF